MIIASDGVWDRLSDEEVVRIVGQYFEKGLVEQAAEKLVTECSNAWQRDSASRDDITCVIVFFQNIVAPSIKVQAQTPTGAASAAGSGNVEEWKVQGKVV